MLVCINPWTNKAFEGTLLQFKEDVLTLEYMDKIVRKIDIPYGLVSRQDSLLSFRNKKEGLLLPSKARLW